MFDNEKKQALKKILFDKSKKGFIDNEILSLITTINNSEDFYTTSSCAGRISIFAQSSSGLKKDSNWIAISHTKITTDFFNVKLPEQMAWFMVEPPIIHLVARNINEGDKVVKIANNSGFRRSCLLAWKKRIIIEINIPDRMNIPLSQNHQYLLPENYLKLLVQMANIKLDKSRKKLKKFELLFNQNYKQNKK